MKSLVIVCDLGRVRAFRVHRAGADPSERSHLSEILVDCSGLHGYRLHELVSDRAGRFPGGGRAAQRAGGSHGESHHLEGELEREAAERLAARIGGVLEQEHYPPWQLVAPATLGPRLRKHLSLPARDTLSGTRDGDLAGMTLSHLEELLL